MEIPRKVLIAGREYTVHTGPGYGASFDCCERKIVLGKRSGNEALICVVHEIFEAILTERLNRYQIYTEGNDKMLFSFDHGEFCRLIPDFLIGIDWMLKPQYAVGGADDKSSTKTSKGTKGKKTKSKKAKSKKAEK